MLRPEPRPNLDGTCDQCLSRGWIPLGDGIRWTCPTCKGKSPQAVRRLMAEVVQEMAGRMVEAADG